MDLYCIKAGTRRGLTVEQRDEGDRKNNHRHKQHKNLCFRKMAKAKFTEQAPHGVSIFKMNMSQKQKFLAESPKNNKINAVQNAMI